jgi:hypothetical protein
MKVSYDLIFSLTGTHLRVNNVDIGLCNRTCLEPYFIFSVLVAPYPSVPSYNCIITVSYDISITEDFRDHLQSLQEPGMRSRYSDWLRAGRSKGRSSSPCRVKNFLISKSSTPTLGPIQPPIQWVPGALSLRVKRLEREADHSPPTYAEVKKL